MTAKFSKRMLGGWLAVVLVLSMIGAAAATPGDLDPTFGTAGKVMTRFNTGGIVYARFDNNGATGASVALSDGKYLVAGQVYSNSNSSWDIGLVRYNADGSEDETFGPGGMVSLNLGGQESVGGMLVLPNGKILIVGTADDGNRDMLVVRLNSNGTLDTDFGTGGSTRVDFSTSGDEYDYGYALALQADGKIVAVGETRASGTNDFYFAVARFTASGLLDTTFGTGGKVTTGFGKYWGAGAYGLAIQGDGKIVVVGTSSDDENYTALDIAVARYTTSGVLDTSFDGDGKLTTQVGSGNSEAWAVALQTDGKILVAGYANNGTNDDLALLRYNSNDGSLDNTFSGDGIVTLDLGEAGNGYGADCARDLEIVADKILVTGGTQNSRCSYDSYAAFNKIALAQFDASGAPDTTFSANGFTVLVQGVARDVKVQGEQILLAGLTYYQGFFLARLNHDGIPDTEFAANAQGGYSSAGAESIAIQPDGKILAAGYRVDVFDQSDFALARYNADGTLDTTFSADGKVITSIGPGADEAYAVALQRDGKIVVAGMTYVNDNDAIAVARYTTNGTLDTAFDTDGIVVTNVATSSNATAVAIQADGKAIVAANSWNGGNNQFMLVRYNSNGSLDGTFSGDGWATVDFNPYPAIPKAIALQPDGKIIVAGYLVDDTFGYDSNIALARFNSDGTLDNTFGANGKLVTDLGLPSSEATAVALQSNGKIIVGGQYDTNFLALRYTSAGVLDTTFDGDGIIALDLGGYDTLSGLSVLLGDKIVMVGEADTDSGELFGLARLNANGTIDTTFSTDGLLTIPFLDGSAGSTVAIQPNGMIVVAGHTESTDSGNNIFALARIEGDPAYQFYMPIISR